MSGTYQTKLDALLPFVPAAFHADATRWVDVCDMYGLSLKATFRRYAWWLGWDCPGPWHRYVEDLTAAQWQGLITDSGGWGRDQKPNPTESQS